MLIVWRQFQVGIWWGNVGNKVCACSTSPVLAQTENSVDTTHHKSLSPST